MTDTARLGLKVIVERAVRPVRAPLVRKRKMREELLGHVDAVFDEESARLGDEHAALAETERRFGNPAEVAEELQRTVSAWSRFEYGIERLAKSPPGASPLRRATRWALFIAGLNTGMIAVVVPAAALFDREPRHLWIAAQMLAMIAVGSATLTFAFVLLSDELRRALFDPTRRRSVPRAAGVAVLSCVVPAALLFASYFALLGETAAALDLLRRATVTTPMFLMIPAILLLATREIERENRYLREWADLRID